jgi:NADPH-dependent 2,4-dienoyl-CoA reductase/sulfur reductase-like enzyme/ferredoxin
MTAPTRSSTALRRPTIVRGALASALRPTARTAEIEVHEPDAPPRTVTVDDALVVGRETQGLQLLDPSVSRRHLVLRVRRGGLTVEDLGSPDGTMVNGQPIATESALSPGDRIELGGTEIVVLDPHVATRPAEVAAPVAAAPTRKQIPVRAELPTFPNYTQLPRRMPIAAWHGVRVVSVLVYLVTCVALIVRPAGGIFFFWRIFVPTLPLLLLVAPGVWRNICPVAATNQLPRLFGFTKGRAAPAWLRDRGGGYLIAVTLFVGIVASRKVLFNRSGPATAVLLLAVISLAFLGGWIYKGKSGWCSSHCPMLPVERLYGQTPYMMVPNAHCQPCVGCTKHCYDFNPGVAYQADIADPDPKWSAPRKFFAGAFPGVVIGFFGVKHAANASAVTIYAGFALAVLVTAGLFFLIDAYLRVPTALIAAFFGVAAINLFYWYGAPLLLDAYGQVLHVDIGVLVWPLRGAVLVVSLGWLSRTVLVHRRFLHETTSTSALKLAPTAAKALAASAAGDRPEIQFVPDDKRVVAQTGQSILEVAEAAGLPIEVGCRLGLCGADPIAIVAGMEHLSPIEGEEESTLRRLGLASNTRLACCARLGGPVCVSLTPERADAHRQGSSSARGDPDLRSVVVIGNGIAGITTADYVRRGHPDCEIHVIGREPHPLYNRMGIARLVYGRSAMQGLYLLDDDWYEEHGVTTWLNTHASAINLRTKSVHLATGQRLPYDKLVLAMGSASTVLDVAGWGRPGCFVLREAADALAMRQYAQLHHVETTVVAGAGLLGLEAAHSLREFGLGVVVLDRGPRVMARQSDERCSELLASYFEGLGIEILASTEAREVRGEGRVEEVVLSDGTSVGAQMLVLCAGITPNIDLAQAAGISCGRGVQVDDRMRTSAADVFAVGDVAELDGQIPGLWPTAVGHAEVAASNVLGNEEHYVPSALPVLLKGVGLDLVSVGRYQEATADDVVTLDGPGFQYRKLVLTDGRLEGAILLGRPDEVPHVLAAVKQHADVRGVLEPLRAGDWSVLERGKLASSVRRASAEQ